VGGQVSQKEYKLPTKQRSEFKVCPKWKARKRSCEVRKETGRWKSRFTIRDLLADVRCSQMVLDFFSTTDVARLVPAENDAGSEAPEWELRERRKWGEEQRMEVEELGAGGKGPLILPMPSYMASTGGGVEGVRTEVSFP